MGADGVCGVFHPGAELESCYSIGFVKNSGSSASIGGVIGRSGLEDESFTDDNIKIVNCKYLEGSCSVGCGDGKFESKTTKISEGDLKKECDNLGYKFESGSDSASPKIIYD